MAKNNKNKIALIIIISLTLGGLIMFILSWYFKNVFLLFLSLIFVAIGIIILKYKITKNK